jgi:hypothetical protein
VQKSVLLAAVEKEIHRHDLSYFVDEPPSRSAGRAPFIFDTSLSRWRVEGPNCRHLRVPSVAYPKRVDRERFRFGTDCSAKMYDPFLVPN